MLFERERERERERSVCVGLFMGASGGGWNVSGRIIGVISLRATNLCLRRLARYIIIKGSIFK